MTQDPKMLFDSLLSTLEMELRASLDSCVTGMVATARTQLEAVLAEVAKERAKGLAEVARERAELHREIEAMQTHTEAQEGRVELNIGGRRFETSVQTLRRVPHTFFDAYFSGRYAQDVCADGSIFVDRDGEHFDHVLEYMRDGVVSVATQDTSELDISLLRALKREFGFYCIELMAEPEEVIFVVGCNFGFLSALSVLERFDNARGVWLKGASMITARSCFTLCEVGGLLNAAGGLDGEGGQLASVECYDPILDTWSVAPAMPRRRSHHSGCTVGESLYILGGMEDVVGDEHSLETCTTSVLKFDSSTQAWSEVAPMPEARANFVACVLNDAIYVVGGYGNDFANDNLTDTNFCYNTVTNVWSTLAPIPDTKLGHSVCVVSGQIYVLGGQRPLDPAMASSVHRFNPVTNVWSAVAPMSTPRCGLTSFVLGGSLYVAGGFDGVDDLRSVERYNAVSDTWETVRGIELSGPRVDFGAQVMRLEVGLFDILETKARRARS
jgi:hypothetical protein